MQKACAIYLLFVRLAEVGEFGTLGAESVWGDAAGVANAGAIGIEPEGVHSSAMGLSLVGADPIGVGLVCASLWVVLWGCGAEQVMCVGCSRVKCG